MFHLRSLLLIPLLTLFFPIHAFTVTQSTQGHIPGSLSGPHKGDWFIETRCDCFTLAKPHLGFIYLWEYYNYHSNATYLLAWMDSEGLLDAYNQGGWVCREYAHSSKLAHSWSRRRKTDKFCFRPQEFQDWKFDWEDHIEWNGQQRGLGKYGKQGLRKVDQKKVDGEICPAACKDWMGYEHHVEDSSGKGEQKFWDHLDDMCDECF